MGFSQHISNPLPVPHPASIHHSTCLRVAHVNINGLFNKLPSTSSFTSHYNLSILGVSESHLQPNTPNSFVDILGYNLFRNDSDSGVAKHGVCCYVCHSLKVTNVYYACNNCISFQLPDYKLQVVVVYRPLSYSASENY